MPDRQHPNLGLIQARCRASENENLDHIVSSSRELAQQGANIIATQELFLGPYFCQTEDHQYFQLAEPIPGPTTERLQSLCQELEIVMVASLFEKRAAGLYHNTAVVIDADGTVIGRYRKMHIPDDPQFHEKFYFTPGDLGFKTFKTRYANLGILICWDQWYPEAARLTALAGADILIYPTAIGWLPSEKDAYGKRQHQSWETIQRAHAIANGCYVAAINRVGLEKQGPNEGIEFWGQSFIADPSGQIITRAGATEETLLSAEIELEQIDTARTHWPFLRDRRIDAYAGLNSRFLDK